MNLLSDKIVKSNKKLIVRLIGVMENDVGGIVDETKFIPQLEMLKSKLGARLKIGAETLGYAEFLTASINCQVDYLPFPLTNNCPKKSYQELKSIKFGFLGAPREDKGYYSVPDIIYSIKGILPSAKFVIQGEKAEDKIWDSIQSNIKSDITYTKSPLEHGVILDLLAQCDFVILPYDENVYKHRGSAIMFEALEVGVSCITFMNPAFARDIEAYKIGLVFNSIRELEIKELVDFQNGYESNRLKYIALTNETFLNSLRFV